MKNIKKILFGILAFILSITTLKGVLAEGAGSIEISGTTLGKTYEIYKIFDLTYSGSNVSYTIDEDWMSFFEGNGSSYIVDTDLGGLNPITIGSTTKYINVTDANIEEFTKDALEYASSLEGNDKEAIAEGETLTFDNLALGYYLVYPKGASDVMEGYGTICSITSTMPNGVVNIKATYPTITKTVDDANAEVGQLVQFTITGRVPDTTGYKTYTYQIKDVMSSGLELDANTANMSVKFGGDVIEVSPIYEGNSFTLTFEMVNYQDYVGDVITVTYKALVTKDAVDSDNTKNSATLTYSNDPKTDTTFTTPEIEVFVYSSKILVTKVDAKNRETKLSGASFVIQNEDGLYYRAIGSDGEVITNTNLTDDVIDIEWVENIEDASTLVTDETGIVSFNGVENGTYYLVETEAPEGYNKLTGPVTLKVGYTDEEGTNLGNIGVSHEEIVENNSGTVLPSTGGMGTVIFILIGSLLMISSLVIYVSNKKME